jgi:hypothetical protein
VPQKRPLRNNEDKKSTTCKLFKFYFSAIFLDQGGRLDDGQPPENLGQQEEVAVRRGWLQPRPVVHQGSILQNSISAEKFRKFFNLCTAAKISS